MENRIAYGESRSRFSLARLKLIVSPSESQLRWFELKSVPLTRKVNRTDENKWNLSTRFPLLRAQDRHGSHRVHEKRHRPDDWKRSIPGTFA
jgi:hypothetical protein